jgi:hypothetical protein
MTKSAPGTTAWNAMKNCKFSHRNPQLKRENMAILKLRGQLLLRDKVKNTRSKIHTTLYCVWRHTAIMLLDNDHCKGPEWGCWQSSMTPVSSWPAHTHTHTQNQCCPLPDTEGDVHPPQSWTSMSRDETMLEDMINKWSQVASQIL